VSFTREFNGVLAFAQHLLVLKVAVREAEHKALEQALVILEDDAVGQIGHYQGAAGPYPAWAPLAESTEVEKARLGYQADAPLLREGDLQKSFSHQVNGDEGVVGSTSDVMPYHEFGTSKMPPRPVLGPALFHNRNKIDELLGRALVEAIVGGKILSGYLEKF